MNMEEPVKGRMFRQGKMNERGGTGDGEEAQAAGEDE